MRLDNYLMEGCILQRNQDIIISGKIDQGENLCLSINNKEYHTSIIDHHFIFKLNFKEYGGPYSLKIENEFEQCIIHEVYIGDVYLLAGQSNIEFKLKQSDEKHINEIDRVYLLTISQYEYEKDGIKYPEANSYWVKANKDNLKEFSAIGYYIANKIRQKYPNLPIGLISCNKGGTSASCWIDKKTLMKDDIIYSLFYKKYYQSIKNQTDKEEDNKRKAYFKQFDLYQQKVIEYQKKYPNRTLSQLKQDLGHTPWPLPRGKKDFGRPSGLYEMMLSEIKQISFCSIIWYQGEEDTKNGEYYQRLLTLLVNRWKEIFGNIPFYIVQLPRYQDDKNDKWKLVREAQYQVSTMIDRCYTIPTIDTGELFNIHPVNKKETGNRIGDAILKYTYSIDNGYQTTILSDYQITEQGLVLTFSTDLLKQSYQIKVDDQYREAKRINTNQLLLVIDKSHEIMYAYENYPEFIIYNINYIPVFPFKIEI